jgi:hypothetical protein
MAGEQHDILNEAMTHFQSNVLLSLGDTEENQGKKTELVFEIVTSQIDDMFILS